MSLFVKYDNIPKNLNKKIQTELVLQIDPSKFEELELFDIEYERTEGEGSLIHLPFAWARNNCEIVKPKILSIKTDKIDNEINEINEKDKIFQGKLRPNQIFVKNETLKHLNERGSAIISAKPGFGKTITSIDILCFLNVPTLIFVKQAIVTEQWITSLKSFAPQKKILKLTKNTFDESADVYIANPILFKKNNNEVFFKRNRLEMLKRIKFVIVDELHQIISKILHKALFKVSPDYLLGLSATPYRPKQDPMLPAINLFFGDRIIENPLFRKHFVFVVKTNFFPEIKINKFTNKLDWNSVLNDQAKNQKRNDIIIQCIQKFPNQTWLVLVKRVEHANILNEMLKKLNIENCTLTGSTKTFDKKTKILIGTTCKLGTGFDHSPIDGLIIASDCVEYFEQFLGRCMRRQDVEPIIFDFEDSFGPLKKHLAIRVNKYKLHGGNVIFVENVNFIKSKQTEKNTQTEIILLKKYEIG
jgi:superfamily II DNA or RNA helicase